MIQRKKTRRVMVASVPIGDSAPIVIQSMTNTQTEDIESTLEQISRLASAGCSIVRLAIPHQRSLEAFARLRPQTTVPLVADIHFQHDLAIQAIEAGADKVRINPGNIGSMEKVMKVVDAAVGAGIPLRIGVNAGSLEKQLLQKYGGPTAEALVESAHGYIRQLHDRNFDNFIVSIKASDVLTTVTACRKLSQISDVAQHIGITESGTIRSGTIRSSVGIGILLADGIGDTIRVSLSGDPLEEIPVAQEILKSLNLYSGPVVLACPTCSRTGINVAELARQVEEMVKNITVTIHIAVMGCVVNGPGEAAEADVGIAAGAGHGVIFVRGKQVERVAESQLLEALWRHVQAIVAEKEAAKSTFR
ncbi:MAG: flavodoxin-dependent (E)-4-hydroxy-3-methylbut-2-enyl-diphosphate synthase [Chitinivibrionales bacterium]|nr:flavodoxin-dependent (E)-4-hydroxy-3-methylbut-2-enyl-diphosphate synthase [Chitinivibrionales bacterium]